jgi:hypothetical protein
MSIDVAIIKKADAHRLSPLVVAASILSPLCSIEVWDVLK